MQYFTSVGLKELWIRFGTGQNKRFIPVHKLSYKLGPHMCSNLFQAHILTGSDTTSKIGTKGAAIKREQINYLNNCGLEYSIKSQFENAEKYLVAVLQKNYKSENFDELSKSLTEVAPTSSSIEGNLSHYYYVVYNSINVLNVTESLNPVMYEWKSSHDGFPPEKRGKE